MKKHPRPTPKQRGARQPLLWLGLALLLAPALFVACSQEPETVTVEVTRVVTETVVEEGETVEVTRVVTETVVETIEIEPEEETAEEPPSATGSEGDAEPLPPPPDDGPKVAESRGSTPAADLALETAVALRTTQPNSSSAAQEILIAQVFLDPTELQKWCQLVTKLYKKRCV
jgi:hypothetical protein